MDFLLYVNLPLKHKLLLLARGAENVSVSEC